MSSQAQLNANRANAQHSTGPQTEAGKQQSSLNAVKHGFYSKAFLIPDGEQEDFNQLRTRLENVYEVTGGLGLDLFQQLLHETITEPAERQKQDRPP